MSNYRNLTTKEIENIIAISEPTITGYLTRFKDEIEVKVLKNCAVLKLPLHPENACELRLVNQLENAVQEVLKVKKISTYLQMSKDYLSVQEYQRFTKTTAIYPQHQATNYLGLGLASEAGEVTGVLKKWVRGDYSTKDMREKLAKELGDVLWYVARLADEQHIPLVNIFIANMEKLQKRKESGVIKGDGDDR